MTYGPLHRTAWGIAIGWVIFACSRGYGGKTMSQSNAHYHFYLLCSIGVVNRILSWKGFIPLARLTYCAYLIHIDFLNVYFATERRLYYYTFYGQLVTYMGLLLTILVLAFVISVTVEASFLNLEKLIFCPTKRGIQRKMLRLPTRSNSTFSIRRKRHFAGFWERYCRR